MGKWMKKGLLFGLGAIAVVVAVVAIGLFFLFSNLDSLVKAAIEDVGSEAVQAKVTVDDLHISLRSGEGVVGGLRLENPAGFKSPWAFQFAGIKVAVDTGQISGETVVIREIVVDRPKVTYELGDAGSNIDAIQRNVDAYARQFSGDGGGATSDPAGDGPKLIIENLFIRNGEISVSAAFLGGKRLTVPLPDIHLANIGSDSGGVSPAQVVKQIVTSMTGAIVPAVGTLNLDALAIEAGAIEGATKTLRGLLGD